MNVIMNHFNRAVDNSVRSEAIELRLPFGNNSFVI